MEDEHIFTKFVTSLKRKWLLVLLAVLGVGLVLLGGRMTGNGISSTQTTPVSDEFEDTYRRQLEEDIASMCRKIEGVGNVSVMVTLSKGNQYTYNGGKMVAHDLPAVCGVAVICDGGNNERVQGEIVRMVSALLNIGTHRIYVGKSQ